MATRSSRNNSGAVSSSSSSSSTSLRVVARTVTELTLNMPTTPAQLTEMIASAVATALTNQQSVNRDLFFSANTAKMILDSGAGISGVGEQWKLTDISRMSSMSIQGAFGDSMRPSIQGLLGREKLPALLVPRMKDDIYSLSRLLNSNGATGAKDKVAIFTKNGAIILTADS